ncbi:unnamed protein product [Ambrosiozyma monospora]|uniref:UDP-N-acetylglucosamine diphosphorylase n=1 Tax=Ambrosiozyma monospora TaxID=43982 RepID=A0A9W6YST3_AMBMO|nr:unnamed protein product [Ambrosiozyma monospora]
MNQRIKLLTQLQKLAPNPESFLVEVGKAIELSSSMSTTSHDDDDDDADNDGDDGDFSSKQHLKPLPESNYVVQKNVSVDQRNSWQDEGYKLISEGKVGLVVLAGGQGSRLGSSEPKGCFDVGLPSHRSLFQLQVERIVKLKQLTREKTRLNHPHDDDDDDDGEDVKLPLYVMTSSATHDATKLFFKEHDWFGLPSEDVIFFNQGMLPALSLDGKHFLLESPDRIVESPDGGGGLYKAWHDNGIIEDWLKRGIEHVHVYCVDNILVKVGDPEFIGFAKENKFNIVNKVVAKRDATESVGLILLDDDINRAKLVEYSEISKELSELTDEQGDLVFKAANIVNHYYNVKYLSEMVPTWVSSREYLPYHVAKKKIGVFDSKSGETVKPEREPNGIKMEQFMFDVFPFFELEKFACLEVERNEEFSPLKNGYGSENDSPETSRLNFLKRSTQWVLDNGGLLENDDALVEVTPLTSYGGEHLKKLVEGKTFKNGDIL